MWVYLSFKGNNSWKYFFKYQKTFLGEGGQTQHFPKLHWTYSYIKYFNGFLTEIFGISHWGHDIVFSVLLKNIFCLTDKAKETTGDKYLPNSQWACNFFTMTILDLEPQDICNCNVIFFSAQHHFHFLAGRHFLYLRHGQGKPI